MSKGSMYMTLAMDASKTSASTSNLKDISTLCEIHAHVKLIASYFSTIGILYDSPAELGGLVPC